MPTSLQGLQECVSEVHVTRYYVLSMRYYHKLKTSAAFVCTPDQGNRITPWHIRAHIYIQKSTDLAVSEGLGYRFNIGTVGPKVPMFRLQV